MGFEYRFKLAEGDLDTLARQPDGIASVDALLRALPGFQERRDETYFYGEARDRDRWPSTITVAPTELVLCLYDRRPASPDATLLRTLMDTLLDRCGHLEVEDA